MYIYEIKNVVVDEKVVNGLVFKSSVDKDGNTEPALIAAEEGDKVCLIYAYLEDDVPVIDVNNEYVVKFNEDATKVADGVKIFEFQGKTEIGGAEVAGLIFKPAMSLADCGSVEDGETVVVIAEHKGFRSQSFHHALGRGREPYRAFHRNAGQGVDSLQS